jgi:hypothetical protein
MRSRSSHIQVITYGAWRFAILDDRAAGWKLVLHPPAGPTRMIGCAQADGLPALLAEARALADLGEAPAPHPARIAL